MDRNTALSALIDLRQILIEEGKPKIAVAVGVGIEALGRTDTDCISRQVALAKIRIRLQDWAAYGNEEYRRGLYACEDMILSLPPVNQNQITGKLESVETATSEGDESTMGQPKSKLDLISRQEVLGYIDRLTNSGLGKMKSLEYIQKYVERMEPSVAPKPVGDCISRQQAIDGLCQNCEAFDCIVNGSYCGHDCTEVEILRSLPPVTPTERTGEWVFLANIPISGGASSAGYICSNCGEDYFKVDRFHYCPNCGAKMGGDTE